MLLTGGGSDATQLAVMKFEVIMTNPDDTNLVKNYLILKEIYVSQNQTTLVTEIRLSHDRRIYGLKLAHIERSPESNSRLIKM